MPIGIDWMFVLMNARDSNEDDSINNARDVEAFYDRWPYPPPVKDLEAYGQDWLDENRRRADYHLHWPDQAYRETLNILVAGCGTSQAAKHAIRRPADQVVGIDVSATSIQHSMRLKRRYNLDNLDLHQLPLESVRDLGQQFDKIVCTGVLHHLADPVAGLRALREVLLADGVMHLMVYASYGRYGIYMLQEYCRRLGIGRSDAEIRDLANALMFLPIDHPLGNLLANSPDFRSRAGLADALLHPQDRAYTVPQLFELLEQARLDFSRWVRQAPYLPHCGDLARTPHGAQLALLSPSEQYAAVELFRGTMIRHNVVAYRSDKPGGSRTIHFDGQRWLNYVPIRLPRTLCIDERAPAGKAAVLINQSHTYRDIVLPIDADEKRLIDAINGQISISEITKKVSMGKKRLRAFIERLWQYDQIAFDASNTS